MGMQQVNIITDDPLNLCESSAVGAWLVLPSSLLLISAMLLWLCSLLAAAACPGQSVCKA